MSAKPTKPEAEEKVNEVAKQLSETKINEDDAKAKAKADKKARQKAKKDAESITDANPDAGDKEKTPENSGENATASKSSKKKNKSKGKSGGGGGNAGANTQTDPPSIPVSQLFPSGNYPEGQIMDHPIANDDAKAKQRFTSEEARALDRAQLDMYNEIR